MVTHILTRHLFGQAALGERARIDAAQSVLELFGFESSSEIDAAFAGSVKACVEQFEGDAVLTINLFSFVAKALEQRLGDRLGGATLHTFQSLLDETDGPTGFARDSVNNEDVQARSELMDILALLGRKFYFNELERETGLKGSFLMRWLELVALHSPQNARAEYIKAIDSNGIDDQQLMAALALLEGRISVRELREISQAMYEHLAPVNSILARDFQAEVYADFGFRLSEREEDQLSSVDLDSLPSGASELMDLA